MSRKIQNGRWFTVETKGQHDCLKAYGKTVKSANSSDHFARVQKGAWAGPGKYMLLSYEQRCPRGCCYDSVYEVLSAADVADDAKDQMRDLAGILKQARSTEG
jgi:hypothetical protein